MIKLRATIKKEHFPFLEEDLTIVNRKVVNVRGGTIVFSVTPLYVVAVQKVINLKSWTNTYKTYETSAWEIKVPIEIVEV